MIVDGRSIAADVLVRTKARAGLLSHPPRVIAIVGSETPATLSYLKIKVARAADAGCTLEVRPLGAPFADADAAIIQLPLPVGVDRKELCDSISVEKDADVLSSAARGKFESGDTGALLPPVVGAIRELFMRYAVDAKGKGAVVIGDGWLVGNPAATWLAQQGAQLHIVTRESKDLSAALRSADIIVSGAGSPGLITPDMLKTDVVLIDAGTSESGGTLAGDADLACAAKCSLFTPVPGGIGPLAVACLFENAVTLAERSSKKP